MVNITKWTLILPTAHCSHVRVCPAARASCETVAALLAELLPQAMGKAWSAEEVAARQRFVQELRDKCGGFSRASLERLIGEELGM